MGVEFWLDFVARFGLPFALVCLFIFAAFKKWIVFWWVFEAQQQATTKAEQRAEKWESRALQLLEAAAKSAQAAERAVVKTMGDEDQPRRRGRSS